MKNFEENYYSPFQPGYPVSVTSSRRAPRGALRQHARIAPRNPVGLRIAPDGGLPRLVTSLHPNHSGCNFPIAT